MERSLFGFIIRYSKRDQLLIVPLVLATMVVYYLSLDLPKIIINRAIQGDSFKQSDTTTYFGLDLGRIEYLLALSIVFLSGVRKESFDRVAGLLRRCVPSEVAREDAVAARRLQGGEHCRGGVSLWVMQLGRRR